MNETAQILIVDDEPSARQTAEMLLLREGHALHFAEDAYEALAHLDDEDEILPDVILLDVMMPGMDGFELCKRLKRNEKWSHIPIILITALDSKQDLARGLDAGADDFLHKPYHGLELRARVRSMLRIKARHDDLQTMLKLRQDLANMIVHDIRSPLSSILIHCDLLEEYIPEGVDNLSMIRGESVRLSGFLTDMLMLAKMEHGRLVLVRSHVNINEMAVAVYDSYSPIAHLKEVEFVLDLPSESIVMSLDKNLWRRVLDNLVSNAIKFSPANTVVTLRIRQSARVDNVDEKCPQLCVEVIDQGPGIPNEYRETIFDQFKIIASGRRDVKQVGLGLAFCKMVVDAHEGEIYVKSNTPNGSIFMVEL